MSEEFARERSVNSSLLSAARAHDTDAWSELLERFGRLVYSWGRMKGLQPADADDLCQDVFLSVSRGLGSFRRDQEGQSFRLWLWIITQNKIRDRFRRARAGEVVDGSQALRVIDAYTVNDEMTNQWCDSCLSESAFEPLSQAVAKLRATMQGNTWDAFWLCTVEGLSPDVVADRLRMTRNSVYVAKSRVVNRLRVLLATSEDA